MNTQYFVRVPTSFFSAIVFKKHMLLVSKCLQNILLKLSQCGIFLIFLFVRILISNLCSLCRIKGLIRCENGSKIKKVSTNYGRTFVQMTRCVQMVRVAHSSVDQNPQKSKGNWFAIVTQLVIYRASTDSSKTLVQRIPNIWILFTAVLKT